MKKILFILLFFPLITSAEEKPNTVSRNAAINNNVPQNLINQNQLVQEAINRAKQNQLSVPAEKLPKNEGCPIDDLENCDNEEHKNINQKPNTKPYVYSSIYDE